MPRRPKCRMIQNIPLVKYFKPRGIPLVNLEEVVLPLDGLEALRLTDIEGLNQDLAAEKMQVSRQTFGRILAAARQAVAEAIVLGKALRVDGGHYAVCGRGEESDKVRPAPEKVNES